MNILQRLIAIRTGGATERCHGIRHQGSYSVAAHTWGVLTLLYVLWPKDFARLAAVVTFHDVPEAWIGDIPAPTKRYHAAVKAACNEMDGRIMQMLDLPLDTTLLEEDQRKVKNCDHLELYIWAKQEVYGGNNHAACVARELERYFAETQLLPEAYQLFAQLQGGSVENATDRLIMEINKCG